MSMTPGFVFFLLLAAASGCASSPDLGCALEGAPGTAPPGREAFHVDDAFLAAHPILAEFLSAGGAGVSVSCEEGARMVDDLARAGASVRGTERYGRDVVVERDNETWQVFLGRVVN